MMKPAFLDTSEYTEQQVREMMNLGAALKACVRAQYYPPLMKKQVVLFYEENPRPPLRTAFETAAFQLGGALFPLDCPIDAPEHLKLTASRIEENADCAVIACERHETLLTLSKYADVPIINAGSAHALPVQEIAMLITMFEHLPTGKKLEECKIVFDGASDALCCSTLYITTKIGMQFVQLASEKSGELQPPILKQAERNVKKSGGTYAVTDSAAEAYHNADFLVSAAPLGAKLPPEATGVMRVDALENVVSAARAILTGMLYKNPASREPILVEKMKRMLAVKLQAIFGYGEANE